MNDINEEVNKYCDPCINFDACKGKWFKYKAKQDNGYCKACIKKENEKHKEIKLDNNRNYIYDCKTIGCVKDLRFQKTDYC